METKKAPQIPYGISDFVRMRTENYYYVDKTMYIPLIERSNRYFFFYPSASFRQKSDAEYAVTLL